MTGPSWGIVTTLDEPAPLIVSFVAHHLALGAREAHVFVDRPNPAAEAVLNGLPGVILTSCDAAYWAGSKFRRRPPRHASRQMFNATSAYRRAGVDWLLHLDCDEFVIDAPALVASFAAAPASAVFVQLGVLERVHLAGAEPADIFAGIFRRQVKGFPDWGPDVYGRFAKFMHKGLSGHIVGKAAVRVGLDLGMGIHFPNGYRDPAPDEVVRLPDQLLHFDGLTRLHYALKLLYRLYLPKVKGNPNPHGVARGQQIRFAGNHSEREREMNRLFDGTRVLDPRQVEKLDALGALANRHFDPRPGIAAMGLALPDLSPAAFDAELRERAAALIEKSGLRL